MSSFSSNYFFFLFFEMIQHLLYADIHTNSRWDITSFNSDIFKWCCSFSYKFDKNTITSDFAELHIFVCQTYFSFINSFCCWTLLLNLRIIITIRIQVNRFSIVVLCWISVSTAMHLYFHLLHIPQVILFFFLYGHQTKMIELKHKIV